MSDEFDKPFPVPRRWPESTIVLIAGGRSLTAQQICVVWRARKTGRCRVIAINDAYRIAPWADVLYFADGSVKWYGWHKDRPEFKAFRGMRLTIEAADRAPGVHWLKNYGTKGLSENRDGVMSGSHSGHQALNIAIHLGARRIVLLGYDCRGDHWFGEHPNKTAMNFGGWIANFRGIVERLAALNIKVLNCSPGSAIDAFPKRKLESALQ